jgi:hypothetical protein
MSYQFKPAEFERREELFGDRREVEDASPHRLPTVAAAAAVMALFAAGLWFAYWQGTRHAGAQVAGAVPLIRADTRPMMVKPAMPGGLKIPDRNLLIYDPDQRMVEHLLPPPEQPMARPGAAVPPPEKPMPRPVAPAASATPPSAAVPTPAAPAARGGDVRLQLGAVRSADAARLEWDRIRERNRDLLGAVSASPVRTDLGDKGVYWRIETGALGDAAAARICTTLKQRKFGCLIVR